MSLENSGISDAGEPALFVVFTLDDIRLALPIDSVDRVIAAVAISRFLDKSTPFAGVIDVHGELIPVAGLRRTLGIPPRDILPSDRLVLARTAGLQVALPVDAAEVVSGTYVHGGSATNNQPLIRLATGGFNLVPLLALECLRPGADLSALKQSPCEVA